MVNFPLSKSKYCRGVQCPKMLWLETNCPDEKDESVLNQARLRAGKEVGELARGYFGPFTEVPFDRRFSNMAAETRRLMDAGTAVICEATFIHDGDLCLVDILRQDDDGWQLIEVKSASGGAATFSKDAPDIPIVKDVYLDDIAFQYRVLTGCGVNVTSAHLMHLNPDYVRGEELEIQSLFKMIDCTDEVRARQNDIGQRVESIKAIAGGVDEPQDAIGPQCDDPYECAFKAHCWGELLDQATVFNIARLGWESKFAAYEAGVVTFDDIQAVDFVLPAPSGNLNKSQRQQVTSWLSGAMPEVDLDAVKGFLATVRYPLYHLDFETYSEAVPPFAGLKPYQQIPFQYSLHIQDAPGREPSHKEFLAPEGSDPRRAIAERLCQDIPADVCVLAYNRSFEQTRLRELAEQFEDLAEHLLAIRDNIIDLMTPFQQHAFYDWRQQGSVSIKYVLPAMFPDDPELDYHSLEGVQNGGQASETFATLHLQPDEARAKARADLLRYCGLDTFAMVRILDRLHELSAEPDDPAFEVLPSAG